MIQIGSEPPPSLRFFGIWDLIFIGYFIRMAHRGLISDQESTVIVLVHTWTTLFLRASN